MISIIIPAYNEEKYLGKCLDSLCRQTAKDIFEVIVVNNNSTDNTAQISNQYKNRLNLNVIKESKQGRGAARRRGFSATKGNYLLSTDADCQLPPTWITDHLKELHKSNFHAVFGSCLFYDRPIFANFLFSKILHLYKIVQKLLTDYHVLPGFNFSITQSAYRQTKGFSDNLQAGEDIEFSKQLHKLHINTLYKPSVKVMLSSRRYNKGLLYGTWEYFLTFLNYHFRRNPHKTKLSNPR